MENSFTKGKIWAPLMRFTIPVFAAILLQAMYGAVDLLVVGKFGISADVSAVSTGSQIVHTLTTVIVGIATGTTVLIGQKLGEKRPEEAGDAVGSSIVLFAILSVVLTAIMMLFSRQIAQILNAPAEAFKQTVDYIFICSAGLIFIVAYNIFGSIFRGLGDSKTPLITVAIACIANIAGDLLLVAVFNMGAAGAAIATVGAQGMSVLISFFIIRKRKLPFMFSAKQVRLNKSVVRRIARLGVPIALQDLLVSLSFLVILGIVNSLGLVASAGVGVAEKLCMFIMLVPSAFMQSMSSFVAQNIGAGQPGRAKKAMACGMLTAFGCGLIISYTAFFHGEMLAGIFSNEAVVISAAADYLKAYAIDTLLVPFMFCFAGYFSGCGKTTFVMIQGIVGAFCVRIPVSFFVSRAASSTLFHIGLATPASTVVQIILFVAYFIYTERKSKRVPSIKI